MIPTAIGLIIQDTFRVSFPLSTVDDPLPSVSHLEGVVARPEHLQEVLRPAFVVQEGVSLLFDDPLPVSTAKLEHVPRDVLQRLDQKAFEVLRTKGPPADEFVLPSSTHLVEQSEVDASRRQVLVQKVEVAVRLVDHFGLQSGKCLASFGHHLSLHVEQFSENDVDGLLQLKPSLVYSFDCKKTPEFDTIFPCNLASSCSRTGLFEIEKEFGKFSEGRMLTKTQFPRRGSLSCTEKYWLNFKMKCLCEWNWESTTT